MEEQEPLTHDQIIARTQAFYSHLRKNYEDLKLAKQCPCESEETKEKLRWQYEAASELLDLYSHAFETVIYTWMD